MRLFGLAGRKLGHSYSARFFTSRWDSLGIKAAYVPFEMDSVDNLRQTIIENPELEGLNVTIPFKESVIPMLDRLSDEARAIGAVNCIKILRNEGSVLLEGHNTDAYGFGKTLDAIDTEIIDKALVLGTGGASKAVCFALRERGIEPVNVSRHSKKGTIRYEEIDRELTGQCRLIVNTTPVGMWPETETPHPFPFTLISDTHVCIDIIYNPPLTMFLRNSASRGAKIKNGLEMLRSQAVRSAEIWDIPV